MPRTGEHFATNFPLPEGSGVPLRLVTIDHIVQYAEKRQLAGLYQAVLVDMEAATVARFARSQNIPFYCLKAISDEIADILPDFGRYTDADGHLRVAPLLGHVAVRPKYWPAMLRIGQNAKSGARAVAACAGSADRECVICRSHLVFKRLQRAHSPCRRPCRLLSIAA